jgi:hypothetical protein
MVSVHRDLEGVRIQGTRYAICVYPRAEWREPGAVTVRLSIRAPSPPDRGRPVRLERDGDACEFRLDEIAFAKTAAGADELRALHVPWDDLPAFRTGFTLALETGMRACLETKLPRVERVTQLAATLRAAVEPHLARPLAPYAWTTLMPHEASALLALASRIVLDRRTPAEALADAVRLHDGGVSDEGDDPHYAALGAALRRPDVIALLDAARGAAA